VAYRCAQRGLQMNLEFMAMESKAATWCICLTSRMDEWALVYI
jgi:hypothetical protein